MYCFLLEFWLCLTRTFTLSNARHLKELNSLVAFSFLWRRSLQKIIQKKLINNTQFFFAFERIHAPCLNECLIISPKKVFAPPQFGRIVMLTLFNQTFFLEIKYSSMAFADFFPAPIANMTVAAPVTMSPPA